MQPDQIRTTRERLSFEYEAADLAMDGQPKDVQDRWAETRAGHRLMAYKGKTLVVYRLMFDKPTILATWTLTNLKVDLDKGFLSMWEDQDGKIMLVDHTPVEVCEGCFLWHSSNASYEYTRRFGSWSMRLSMSIRTAHHPDVRHDGVTYMLEGNMFADRAN